jgi:hypothetical protein
LKSIYGHSDQHPFSVGPAEEAQARQLLFGQRFEMVSQQLLFDTKDGLFAIDFPKVHFNPLMVFGFQL